MTPIVDLYTDPRDSHPRRHVVTLLAALVAALVLGAVLVDRVGAEEPAHVAPDGPPTAGTPQDTARTVDRLPGATEPGLTHAGGARYQPAPRGSVERWRPLVDQYAWDTDTALAVILCESRGDPEAVNPNSGAAGLFQLLGWDRFAARLFGRWVSLFDPDVNTRVAYALYVDSGERFSFHWSASYSCWSGGW